MPTNPHRLALWSRSSRLTRLQKVVVERKGEEKKRSIENNGVAAVAEVGGAEWSSKSLLGA